MAYSCVCERESPKIIAKNFFMRLLRPLWSSFVSIIDMVYIKL